NELRVQFARRSFDFPTVTTQPHLEVSNTFTTGVIRGNPDFYRESRFELVDNVTHSYDKHTISFGGNYNFVKTTESFPLFYPFEADFPSLGAYLGNDAAVGPQCVSPAGDPGGPGPAGCQYPNVIFFERFQAPNYNEQSLANFAAIYAGGRISSTVRNEALGSMNHTYDGLYMEDKWRATNNLTLNGGLRWEWETWPSNALSTQWKNFDPRLGAAYKVGTRKNVVLRGGFGLFLGIIPAPLLACQIPSCGGTPNVAQLDNGNYPGRPFEDSLNAKTELFAFASSPMLTNFAMGQLLDSGTYPDATTISPFTGTTTGPCIPGSTCAFFGPSVIVRFVQNHQNPYGIQASLALEFEPLPDTTVSISGLHVRGVHLGSFFNVNQPDPQNSTICTAALDTAQDCTFHDSQGRSGIKNLYCSNVLACPFTPGVRTFPIAVYFEATSRWDSQYDGLLVN